MINVLFYCLGNICRSPMAEGIFRQMVAEAGLTDQFNIDSAGTGDWHIGDQAHPGTRAILKQHGIGYDGRSRQINANDLQDHHTYIIGMDDSNIDTVRQRFGDHPRLYKLLDFATETNVTNVPDPYYTKNFEVVYQLVADGCRGLLETIRRNEGL